MTFAGGTFHSVEAGSSAGNMTGLVGCSVPSAIMNLIQSARMKRKLLISVSLAGILVGCAHFNSDVVEIRQDGTKREVHTKVFTLWDSDSQLAKAQASQGWNTNRQSVAVSGLDQSSTSTNINALLLGLGNLLIQLGKSGTLVP